ncbi:hypothetical protein ONA91_05580 [Micromonospora sp. DR5-3]|uniref:hypothetical protein n=1 Tax=unclassified Micromonospora TaxID=2617518 RepID=UPI0011D84720|nr:MULTISPECIES: hypothetical protein [unclassified Micromonospora]MCW3813925.1 hypothetical protein [Micromonospora sp. DR5-3]TYC24533.1 hypothetical protein FXF52_09710 [Micromonospora sp. MP36]
MGSDIEERLAAAAEAMREHDLAGERMRELAVRIAAARAAVAALSERLNAELADVDRLAGLTVSRVVAALRGVRDDALAREHAEVDAARLRLAEAERLLAALRDESARTQARRRRLATSRGEYAALLDERERLLTDSDDPRRSRLLELAELRGRLTVEHRELTDAVRAARNAESALHHLRELLSRASDWSTYDALGGGLVTSMVKHDILDEAAEASAQVDRALAVLRTELVEVPGATPPAPGVAVDGLTRFTDVWLDNVVTDVLVQRRVERSVEEVARSLGEVASLRRLLELRVADLGARLAALEAERATLLRPA